MAGQELVGMASSEYSFIDIAVLDAVRARFAAGDALAILSADLEEVIWANGPGARLFGYPDIEAIMGASAGLGFAQRRQIAATSGFPEIGKDRPVMIRLTRGVSSMAVPFLASSLVLPDGNSAILLASPAAAQQRDPEEMARRAISGFTEAGYYAALVSRGRIVAVTPGYEALGIAAETIAALVEEVSTAENRLIKRRIPASEGRIPAGIARLTDEPATHLLVAVNDPELFRQQDFPVAPREEEREDLPPAGHEGETETGQRGHIDEWYFEANTVKDPAPPSSGTSAVDEEAVPTDVDAAQPDESSAGTAPSEPARMELPPRDAAPVRFAWRTDAEGRFSSISQEFLHALGISEASVIGHSFADIAEALAIDPSREIEGLLDRRDTWSGKTVNWPMGDGGIRIPVDLAALPVYSRNRTFEGFRGFGIARLSDAIASPVTLAVVADPEPARQEVLDTETPDNTAIAEEVVEPSQPDQPDPAREVPDERPGDQADGEFAATPPPPADPFRGEAPVIAIEEARSRRYSDKIIRLAEHRAPATGRGLSTGERNAFREIGDRLKEVARLRAENGAGEEASAGASPANDAERPEQIEEAASPPGRDETARAAAGLSTSGISESPSGSAEDATEAASAPEEEDYFEVEEEFLDAPLPAETTDAASVEPAEDATISKAPEPEIVDFADGGRKPARAAGELHAGAMFDPSVAATVSSAEKNARDAAMSATPDRQQDRPVAELFPAEPARVAVAEAAEVRKEPEIVPSAFAEARSEAASGIEESFLAGLPSPMLVHAGDTLHFANQAFFDMTGYDSLRDLEDHGGLGELFAEPYAQDDVAPTDNPGAILCTKDGQSFPVRAHLQSIPWRGGKALLLALAGAAEPGSRIVAAERRDGLLDARVEEMRTILDTATDGVVLIAPDGSIRSINHPAEALFGYEDREIAGKPFATLFALESQRAAHEYLQGLSDNGVASVLNDGREVIGREAQGRFIPLFMTIGRLPGGNGFCAVLRDITQWKRAEEELTQARAMAERSSSQKSEFLARVSHEIRTPLNAIIGFSEFMMDERFGPISNDRYRDYLRDINRSGNHVLDLVNDLLDISKIEAGEQEMNYEAVSLNEVLVETVAMMQPQANRERVIIRSSFASRLPEIVADLRSIRQIGLNLLSNAVRFTHPGGQVIVSTAYEASGDVIMRVRDTGVGMSGAEIEQALKPFKQINSLKRKRTDGTGLGLPLTKAMVEANRARFAITSTPGEGTLVEVTFPSTRVLAD